MMQKGQAAEAQIRTLIEAWADAVRRHDYAGVLARHDRAIVMFDVPPLFNRAGWMSTGQPGICSSAATSRPTRSISRTSRSQPATTSPSPSLSCDVARRTTPFHSASPSGCARSTVNGASCTSIIQCRLRSSSCVGGNATSRFATSPLSWSPTSAPRWPRTAPSTLPRAGTARRADAAARCRR